MSTKIEVICSDYECQQMAADRIEAAIESLEPILPGHHSTTTEIAAIIKQLKTLKIKLCEER